MKTRDASRLLELGIFDRDHSSANDPDLDGWGRFTGCVQWKQNQACLLLDQLWHWQHETLLGRRALREIYDSYIARIFSREWRFRRRIQEDAQSGNRRPRSSHRELQLLIRGAGGLECRFRNRTGRYGLRASQPGRKNHHGNHGEHSYASYLFCRQECLPNQLQWRQCAPARGGPSPVRRVPN